MPVLSQMSLSLGLKDMGVFYWLSPKLSTELYCGSPGVEKNLTWSFYSWPLRDNMSQGDKRRGSVAPEHCHSSHSPLPLSASTLLALDPWLQARAPPFTLPFLQWKQERLLPKWPSSKSSAQVPK